MRRGICEECIQNMKQCVKGFNTLMLTVAKNSLAILINLSRKGIVGKTFIGEILIRTLPITQMVCKIIIISKSIAKRMLAPN